MFCVKCGTENSSASQYCQKCGAFLNHSEQGCAGTAVGTIERPPENKFVSFLKKRWMIIAPVAILVIVILLTFNSFLAMVSPSYAVKRAADNTLSQVEKRMEGSSLGFLRILSDCLMDGSITTDFSYDDNYSTEVDGSITFLSQSAKENYGIEANLTINDEDLDLTALFNPDRLAFQTSLIDDNFYGVTYDTFKQDIEIFADEADMDDDTVQPLQDFYDYLTAAQENDFSGIAKKYEQFIRDFMGDLKPVKTSERINSNGKTINCKAVIYEITDDDLVRFLEDLKTIVAEDEQLKDYLYSYFDMQDLQNTYTYGGWGYESRDADEMYDDLLDGFDDAIDFIDDEYSGTIQAAFYMSGNDLIRTAVSGNPKIDGDKIKFDFYIDYGKNPETDDIEIVFNGEGSDGYEFELKLTYRSEYSADTVTDTFKLKMDDDGYDSKVELTTQWNKKTGNFDLTLETDYDDFEIEGNLTMDKKGFTLKLEDLLDGSYYDENLDLTIIAAKGASIPNPSYVNLDQWGDDFLTDLQDSWSDLIYENSYYEDSSYSNF